MTQAQYAPARAPTLELMRSDFWDTKTGNREEEDARLWTAHGRWSTQPDNLGKSLNAFFVYWTEGREESPGSLFNGFDRERARRSNYVGDLTELALWGRALRKGFSQERIAQIEIKGWRAFLRAWLGVSESEKHPVDELEHAELPDALLGAGLTPLEVKQARMKALETALSVQKAEEKASLTTEQASARALLAGRAPTAPRGIQEADTLFLQAAQKMAERAPELFDGAVQEVQVGTPDLNDPDGKAAERARVFLEERYKPPNFVTWGRYFAHSFVSGKLRGAHEDAFHAHHVPLGEHEARRKDGPQFWAFAPDAEHIPQPGGTTHTAHNAAFSPRRDPDKLLAFMDYCAVQWARYQAHIRAESDPWPVLPLSAYMVPPVSDSESAP